MGAEIIQLDMGDKILSIDSMSLVGNDLTLSYTTKNLGSQSLTQSFFTIQESEITANVLNYAELVTIIDPVLNQFAYVRESQGIRWISYKGSGLYMWNGTDWVEDDQDIFNQLEVLINNLNLEVSERVAGDITWDYYTSNWTEEPTLEGSTGEGDVYKYTLKGVTRYRLVPTIYASTKDSFYKEFDGSTLSDLIISRG